MIEDFILSWDLFQNVYLTGWLIGLLLSLIGVIVVARNQIFLSAAVSQASTLGIALGLWLGVMVGESRFAWLHSDTFLSVMSVTFAVIAAIITGRFDRTGRESVEAITGWVFLISAGTSILLLAHSPHGLDEIYRLLSSSIIGASRSDVWVFASLFGLTAILMFLAHRRILLFALDPAMATAVGMKLRPWAMISAAWLGLAAGLSMRASGMLYTFGCLILPALIAKNMSREIRTMFFLAPIMALLLGSVGFVLANHFDYPPAQMAVVLQSLLLVAIWGIQQLVRKFF